MYNKILLSGLFFFSLVFSFAFATSHSNRMEEIEGPTPPPTTYNIGNWDNMSNGCVYLNAERRLIINLKLYLSTEDLHLFDDIYYSTSFAGGPTMRYGPIISSDLVSTTGICTGLGVYVYTHEVYNEDYSPFCNANPTGTLLFPFNISLLDEFRDPYPIEDNLSLFVTLEACQGQGQSSGIPSVVYEGEVDICCSETVTTNFGPIAESSSLMESNRQIPVGTSETETAIQQKTYLSKKTWVEKAIVYPNPFKEVLNLKFQGEDSPAALIQLWDRNGRLVHQVDYVASGEGVQEIQIDTSELGEGVYFCKIKTNTTTRTFKVLKLKRN